MKRQFSEQDPRGWVTDGIDLFPVVALDHEVGDSVHVIAQVGHREFVWLNAAKIEFGPVAPAPMLGSVGHDRMFAIAWPDDEAA